MPALLGLFPSLLWREPKPLEPRVFAVACFVELFLSCLWVHAANCTARTTNQEEALEGVLPENTRFVELPPGQRFPENCLRELSTQCATGSASAAPPRTANSVCHSPLPVQHHPRRSRQGHRCVMKRWGYRWCRTGRGEWHPTPSTGRGEWHSEPRSRNDPMR